MISIKENKETNYLKLKNDVITYAVCKSRNDKLLRATIQVLNQNLKLKTVEVYKKIDLIDINEENKIIPLRKDLRRLYGDRCMLTGKEGELEYHHLEKKEYGGKNTVENGALLSKEAHVWLHDVVEANNPRLFREINEALYRYKEAFDTDNWKLIEQFELEIFPKVEKLITTRFIETYQELEEKSNPKKKKRGTRRQKVDEADDKSSSKKQDAVAREVTKLHNQKIMKKVRKSVDKNERLYNSHR